MAVSPDSILEEDSRRVEVENDDDIFLSAVESDTLSLGPEKKVYQTLLVIQIGPSQ